MQVHVKTLKEGAQLQDKQLEHEKTLLGFFTGVDEKNKEKLLTGGKNPQNADIGEGQAIPPSTKTAFKTLTSKQF